MFEPFAYAQTITHVHITPGTQNQTTGARIPATTTSTPIQGDVQDVDLIGQGVRGRQRFPEGLVEHGDRILYTTAIIAPGDQVTIAETDGTTSTWKAETFAREYRLLAQQTGASRRRYLLKRMS